MVKIWWNLCIALGSENIKIFTTHFMFGDAPTSDHDVANLDNGKITFDKFELPSLFGYRDLAQTKFHVYFQKNIYVLHHGVKVKIVNKTHVGRNMYANF